MTVVSKKPEKRNVLQTKINASKSKKYNWFLKCFSEHYSVSCCKENFETQPMVAYWNMHWVCIGVIGTDLQCIMSSAVAFNIGT